MWHGFIETPSLHDPTRLSSESAIVLVFVAGVGINWKFVPSRLRSNVRVVATYPGALTLSVAVVGMPSNL
jgi:hypothetical protein